MSLKSANKTETNIYELEIAIDAETFAAAVNKAYAKAKNQIAIPGFRKGKVPKAMIEKRYGEGFFYEDALEICYPEAAEKAVEESGLEFVATNSVDVKKMDKDGVELVLTITVKPEVELKEYKLLKATQKKVEATDEEINAKIDELRERNSRVEEVEGRNVENGDIVTIDFEGFVDGVAFDGGKGEEYDLTIGAGQFIPGFEEQIIGHAKDEEFDINVTFPEQYVEELAGKDATFKIKLHEIKVKQLPEADDEFAQDVSEFDTLELLKKDIARQIKEDKTNENEAEIQRQLFEKLAENLVAEIPEAMIENEIDSEIRDMDYRLSMQGLKFETYLQYMGMTVEAYREQIRENAENSVKIRLALEKVAALENLEATEEDLNELYTKYSEQYSMPVEEIKKVIPQDTLKKDISVDKAVKFVRENAKVTTARKKKAAAKAEAEEAAE
ncbi:MAG: trigger factor [Ruminococcaceae bacterium]|nr:trigger factor [Oscillospiraceae bacterium]